MINLSNSCLEIGDIILYPYSKRIFLITDLNIRDDTVGYIVIEENELIEQRRNRSIKNFISNISASHSARLIKKKL